MSTTKVAIVTGASSGIGESTANRLVEAGYKVYGTSRKPSQASKKIELLKLDVCDDLSVENLVADVIQRSGRIDLLVNNAGVGILGGAEESSISQAKAIFDTNFFGSVRMIQACLPHMRQQKSGRIINLSSILGRVPAPLSALYSASKHAIEGYSESLDHELRRFNIRSILIEPAFTKTSFDQNNLPVDREIQDYVEVRKKVIDFSKKAMESGGDSAEIVSAVILKAATDLNPHVRYTAGSAAFQMASMRRFLPEKVFDSILRKTFQVE
ncbi:short-chain dehydrogenase/reductase [Bdellovibrio sp. ZAP7]|uniref:oxidoreductase n=1 Tax=Bdellovibrio sp. ZAP7 TaxID=2231053 RepID=UPI00115A4B12|nr:oxidoreductase [Bdellovibrio sp. ZAP7]QDK47082.1 short-chain dehydrogenase/reductase [Bdellovibrio sp. ZAP7]